MGECAMNTIILSNSLTELADRIKDAVATAEASEKTAIENTIGAGHLLHEAKDTCRHGDWLPFLERAGIPDRKAQRFMRLAWSGLKSDTVSDLGGIKAAFRWCAQLRLPNAGEFLSISLENFPPIISKPFAGIWKDHQGYRFLVFNIEEGWFDKLTKPIIKPEFVLPAVYSALGHRFREMSFCLGDRTPTHEWLRELFDEEKATELEAKIAAAEAEMASLEAAR
jgi:Protein of unknown function (DUF3102)